MKKVQACLCLILALTPATAIGDGYFLSAGYKIRAYAFQEGSRLSLRGRISHGQPCSELKITARLVNNDRGTKTLSAKAVDIDWKGRLFASDPVEVPAGYNGWRVEEIKAACVKR